LFFIVFRVRTRDLVKKNVFAHGSATKVYIYFTRVYFYACWFVLYVWKWVLMWFL